MNGKLSEHVMWEGPHKAFRSDTEVKTAGGITVVVFSPSHLRITSREGCGVSLTQEEAIDVALLLDEFARTGSIEGLKPKPLRVGDGMLDQLEVQADSILPDQTTQVYQWIVRALVKEVREYRAQK